jgi:hypothetical protein
LVAVTVQVEVVIVTLAATGFAVFARFGTMISVLKGCEGKEEAKR